MASVPTGDSRPLRSDAKRNRERILEAARELFAAGGLDVPMERIAGRAGVGIGTFYRRFANRDELIDALFEQRMLELVAVAEEALANDDPWAGLERFLQRSSALQARDRGLKEVLSGDAQTLERVARVRERILPLAGRIAERVVESGQARPDLSPRDVPILGLMLGQVVDLGRDVEPDLWRRYLALLLDGVRAEGAERPPLPGRPLSPEQLDAALASHGRRA